MSIHGFDAIPIRGHDFDEHVGIQRQLREACRTMERCGLQLRVWILHANLKCSLELAGALLKRIYRRFDGFVRCGLLAGLFRGKSCLLFFALLLGVHRFSSLAISPQRLQLVLDLGELGGLHGDI